MAIAHPTTHDCSRFNTGPFKHADVQGLGNLSTIALDCHADDGYSTLMGSGYFVNAWPTRWGSSTGFRNCA